MNARTSPKPWPAGVDPRFSAPFRMLESACASGQCTAWSVASGAGALSVFHADELRARGRQLCPSLHPAFDLASLTKPLFVNWLMRRRWSAQTLSRTPLSVLVGGNAASAPPFDLAWQALGDAFRGRAGKLTLLDLLDHAAGLRPWTYFGRRQSFAPAQWLGELSAHICAGLGEGRGAQLYSDLGYFILARLYEGLPGGPRDWEAALGELNLALGTRYSHASLGPRCGASAIPYFPYRSLEAAEDPGHRGDADFGAAHDTNANILAAHSHSTPVVSGHAGLFGNVVDVSLSVRSLMESQCQLATLWGKEGPEQRFHIGLDTPSSAQSLAGLSVWPLPRGRRIFGHLGYSGTAFWFACEGERPADWQVLLTNRVSHRAEAGLGRVPRIAVYSAWAEPRAAARPESICFLVEADGGGLAPIAREDAVSLAEEWCGLRHLSWDEARIDAPADISDLRRSVGRSLWCPG